ncbi:hypothetical protein M0R45_001706 [Rubus argutus]|uniref:Uncharacterized protein n=1 Tax=Rubus argutus TaxID=59490 RepID=A0AAW1VL52_RUBAR
MVAHNHQFIQGQPSSLHNTAAPPWCRSSSPLLKLTGAYKHKPRPRPQATAGFNHLKLPRASLLSLFCTRASMHSNNHHHGSFKHHRAHPLSAIIQTPSLYAIHPTP